MAKPGLSETKGTSIERLDALCQSAAMLLDCEAAVLLSSVGNMKRVIAGHGLTARYKSYEFEFGKESYERGDRVVAFDMGSLEEAQIFGRRLGVEGCQFFLRTPVHAENDFSVALAVLGCKRHAKPTKAKLTVLDNIVALLGKELKSRVAHLADIEKHVTVTAPLIQIIAEVSASKQAVALIDSKLVYLAASPALCKLQGLSAKAMIGKRYQDLEIPAADAVASFLDHALKTRISPPEFELAVEGEGSARRVYRVTISPFSPTNTKEYFLYVSVADATSSALAIQKLEARVGKDKSPREPSLMFLMETLVPRRTIRERKSVNYLTLMSWRQAVRDYQIAALKALKQNIPPELPGEIAGHMAREIESLVGASAFVAVVPMPCGHSSDEHCLSAEIARALGAKLGLPVIRALAAKKQAGSSHPKNNVRRPPMQAVEKLTGPVILVDDVATSGSHVEEAVKLLKPSSGAVFPVVWISGDRV